MTAIPVVAFTSFTFVELIDDVSIASLKTTFTVMSLGMSADPVGGLVSRTRGAVCPSAHPPIRQQS